MPETKLPASVRTVAHHAELAAMAFKDHEITVELDSGVFRSWKCGKPNECAYAFRVLTFPGRILVAGDIGELIVERTHDMLPWCRRSIDSIAYFASKVPHAIPTKAYDQDVADEWIAEQLAGDELTDEQRHDLRSLSRYIDDQHRFQTDLYDSGIVDGCDFPDFSNWNSNFLWCREAIKWLLSRLPETPAIS